MRTIKILSVVSLKSLIYRLLLAVHMKPINLSSNNNLSDQNWREKLVYFTSLDLSRFAVETNSSHMLDK